MGLFNSTLYDELDDYDLDDARTVNKKINKFTKIYKMVESFRYKLLLIGTEDSGKSALLNKIRQLYGKQYNQSQLLAIKARLIQDAVEAIRTLAINTNKLSDGNKGILGRISRRNNDVSVQDFATLLSDPSIQNTMEIASQGNFDLTDSAPYLFENMHKYYRPGYVPTFTDLMHVSEKKTGIEKVRFVLCDRDGDIEELWDIYDVASAQNNTLRKWMHFFDNTTAIIFVASLSGYNEYTLKDCDSVLVSGYIRRYFDKHVPSELAFLIERYNRMRKNKMKESIKLFRDVINLRIFKDSAAVVFLNKSDLFESKIGRYSVKEHFAEFNGSETKDEIIDFFKQKFEDQCKDGDTRIHFHITCAADTSCINKMLESCRSILLHRLLPL